MNGQRLLTPRPASFDEDRIERRLLFREYRAAENHRDRGNHDGPAKDMSNRSF